MQDTTSRQIVDGSDNTCSENFAYCEIISGELLKTCGYPTTLPARFWSKVDRRSPAECWPWLRHLVAGGYGSIKIDGKNQLAHRVAWRLAYGQPIPDGLLIRHSCDYARCCNPAHLILGTHKDNVDDAMTRGRQFTEFWKHRRTVRNQHMATGVPLDSFDRKDAA